MSRFSSAEGPVDVAGVGGSLVRGIMKMGGRFAMSDGQETWRRW